jgi:Phycobilisome protein
MITLLETLIEGAEGTYANTQDLRSLEHLMSSWSDRKETYLAVEFNETKIIDRAMEMLHENQALPGNKPIEKSRIELCRRDITLALRYYSLGMLLQDEEMLKDRFIYWQKNVIQAMGLHHYQGVKFVFKAICEELSKEQANLLKPYFKLGQSMIMTDLN